MDETKNLKLLISIHHSTSFLSKKKTRQKKHKVSNTHNKKILELTQHFKI